MGSLNNSLTNVWERMASPVLSLARRFRFGRTTSSVSLAMASNFLSRSAQDVDQLNFVGSELVLQFWKQRERCADEESKELLAVHASSVIE